MAQERIKELESEVRDLWGHVLGMTALFASLMKTHPQYDHFQLTLTRVLEQLLAGRPAQGMTEGQREAAREYVESLQMLGRESPRG